MTQIDRYGLPLSTASQDAAGHYIEGLDRLLAYNVGVAESLQAALDTDPAFAMPHAALAHFAFMRGDVAAARAAAAQAVAHTSHASPREQAHVAIIDRTVNGKASETPSLLDAHLTEYPRDALMLSLRSGALFYNGGVRKREAMFELFDSLVDDYGEDWWFLTWRAFSHHEIDRIEEARVLAARALELRRNNGNGVHAMAHVHFEAGEADDGAAFMSGWFGEYPERGGFYTHLNWHLALFELARGRAENALAIYDARIAPGSGEEGDTAGGPSGALGAIADASSFLWRCRLYGATDQALPWQPVLELGLEAFPRPGTAWADVHKGMALAASRDQDKIDALIDGLHAAAARGHTTAGSLVAPIVIAMNAFAHEDYRRAADGLEALHAELVALGGSNAQRDVFEETLAEAYLRGGQQDKAEAFLRERLARRTDARDLFRLGRLQNAKGQDPSPALAQACSLWPDADPDTPESRQLAALTA